MGIEPVPLRRGRLGDPRDRQSGDPRGAEVAGQLRQTGGADAVAASRTVTKIVRLSNGQLLHRAQRFAAMSIGSVVRMLTSHWWVSVATSGTTSDRLGVAGAGVQQFVARTVARDQQGHWC